jgi:hypothetical protein
VIADFCKFIFVYYFLYTTHICRQDKQCTSTHDNLANYYLYFKEVTLNCHHLCTIMYQTTGEDLYPVFSYRKMFLSHVNNLKVASYRVFHKMKDVFTIMDFFPHDTVKQCLHRQKSVAQEMGFLYKTEGSR